MNPRLFRSSTLSRLALVSFAPAAGLEAGAGALSGRPCMPTIATVEAAFFVVLLGLHSAAAVSLLWALINSPC